MDEVVRSATQTVESQLGEEFEGQVWAVVALGGWGRGELCPSSDVDLLLLYRRQTPAIERLARGVFYPLWDAKLEVGHGVRTVPQCLGVSALDLASRTALLDARLIAGAPVLAEELRRGILKQLRRGQGEGFFRALASERLQRHAEFAGAEPHLKDGPGGLRDIHGIGWALRVLAEVRASERRPAPLPQPQELPEVADATDFLVRLRNHLHFTSGRRTDQLLARYQPEAAAFMGFGSGAELCEAVCGRMATIRAATEQLWPQLSPTRGWRL